MPPLPPSFPMAGLPAIALAGSKYWPVAIGFFGLGTGYLVTGGQALFRFPAPTREVEKSMALWAFWMSGFMQFLTGIILTVGLTWFDVFGGAPALYMAAVAFTAFGVHWFAVAHRRYVGASAVPEGWMAIAFLVLSILGTVVFHQAGDTPVSILFIGLTLVYLTEIPTRLRSLAKGERWIGLWQILTGLWLMYLTCAVVFNLALGRSWWI